MNCETADEVETEPEPEPPDIVIVLGLLEVVTPDPERTKTEPVSPPIFTEGLYPVDAPNTLAIINSEAIKPKINDNFFINSSYIAHIFQGLTMPNPQWHKYLLRIWDSNLHTVKNLS